MTDDILFLVSTDEGNTWVKMTNLDIRDLYELAYNNAKRQGLQKEFEQYALRKSSGGYND